MSLFLSRRPSPVPALPVTCSSPRSLSDSAVGKPAPPHLGGCALPGTCPKEGSLWWPGHIGEEGGQALGSQNPQRKRKGLLVLAGVLPRLPAGCPSRVPAQLQRPGTLSHGPHSTATCFFPPDVESGHPSISCGLIPVFQIAPQCPTAYFFYAA